MADELLDIYDENNQSLGFTKPRFLVHQDGDWHRVVHVYVINDQGQYLVHLRSPYKDLKPDCWDTHFGGHLTSGMNYEQGAITEIEQEIGLKINPQLLITGDIVKHSSSFNKEHGQRYFYRFNGKLSELSFNDNEVIAVKWLSFAEIMKTIEHNPKIWANNPERFKIADSLRRELIKESGLIKEII